MDTKVGGGSLRPGCPSCHAGQDGHDGWMTRVMVSLEDPQLHNNVGRDRNNGGCSAIWPLAAIMFTQLK
jgi:hypothetical protein